MVPPKLPFPIIIFAIDYLILSYLADFTPILYSTATVRDPTVGAEDVTDMTSFCRKRTEVTFDKSLKKNTKYNHAKHSQSKETNLFNLNQNNKQHFLIALSNDNPHPN